MIRTGPQSVLVVSNDSGVRSQLSAWLEHAGYEVMSCPGPRTAQTLCIGLRGGQCALNAGADLAVLDLHPGGKELVDRSTRTALVDLYLAGNRSVLVLADEVGGEMQSHVNGAAVIARTAERGEFVATVRELLSRQAPRGTRGPEFPQTANLTESQRSSSGRAQQP